MCETVLAGTVDMLKKGTAQLIRNQWGSAKKERGFQVSGLIGIDTKPVVGPVSGWVQVGINLGADKMCYCKTRPSIFTHVSGWVQVGINLVADKMCYCKTRPSIQTLNPGG